MKRLVVDLDGTLTVPDPNVNYSDLAADQDLVAQLRAYQEAGFEIVVSTARNMRRFSESIGKINAYTLPGVVAWLERHRVPYEAIHVGKPWCGTEGFYIDDRAVRPHEFKSLTRAEINRLWGEE